jgi:tryptophan synthase alpha subunit
MIGDAKLHQDGAFLVFRVRGLPDIEQAISFLTELRKDYE